MLTEVEELEQKIKVKEEILQNMANTHTNISSFHEKALEQIEDNKEAIESLTELAINYEDQMQTLGEKQVQAEHELAYLKRDLALAIIKPNVPSAVYKEVTSYFGGKDDEEV